MSRVIVKNIPKEITEIELKNHFLKQGEITDIKIMRNEKGESRKFAFIGFKTVEQAKNTVKYFNNTYVKTCKVQLDEAKVQGDASLNKNKSWSKIKRNEILNKKAIDADGKTNVDGDQNGNDKASKINKLLELAKQISNKNKFDAVGEKMKKELEVNQLDSTEQKSKEVDEKIKVDSVKPIEIEKKLNPKRLYLRNLAFEVKEEDIRMTFEKYGEVTEIHIPINRRTNSSFGYAYVSYATVESSIMALSEMDKTYFQGRIMHITVAMEKQEKILTAPKQEAATGSSEFKKEKKFKMKTNYDNETNWNYLFMNQNAVIESVANKLNIPKSEIMSRDNPNLAVQVAAMETTVLNETKDWLTSNGINLDSLKGKRSECVRSKNIILIKNISCTISREKLEEYFSRYGMLVRFLISPSNTMGLAEFVDKKHAENCMKKLAYFEIDNLPLYLEFSPEGLIKKTNNQEIIKTDASNKTEIDLKKGQGKILFFSNLNFSTKESRLKKFLEEKGFNPINVKIVTHKKDDSDKLLSSGFGFVEFEDEETAQKAIRNLQGNLLDAHSLKIDIAKTSKEDKEKFLNNKRKNETELNDYDYEGELVTNNKIHVKNLAFEANKEELRKLFKTFGEVKCLRIPTKLDGTHRGFAFIEFVSHDEAKSAFKSLQNTHFYGRKLVLEWAQKEKTVEDLRLQTERKVNAINIKTHRKQTKGEFEIK